MSRYTVEITGFVERRAVNGADVVHTTVGGLLVKPGIHLGEAAADVLFGITQHGVSVREIITTNEVTALLASSKRDTAERRRQDIFVIADVVGRLANNPETALLMMAEDPFHELSEW
ncbi:MAG TPA: hypothetical protein VMR45_00340 [Patescibacteria group bacterium]|nr:hypothetical protein [Patescibacteria group bacterium]